MIQSFRDRDSEALFRRATNQALPEDIDRPALRRLAYLDAARDLHDLTVPPLFRLCRLGGERGGQYALHIAGSWYIRFTCRQGDPLAGVLSEIANRRKSP